MARATIPSVSLFVYSVELLFVVNRTKCALSRLFSLDNNKL